MPPPNRRYRVEAKPKQDTSSWTPQEIEAANTNIALNTPIAEMPLSVRVVNTFEQYGIIRASDLVRQSYETLMSMENFGEKTMVEVRAAVASLGLPIAQWKKPPKARRQKKKPK